MGEVKNSWNRSEDVEIIFDDFVLLVSHQRSICEGKAESEIRAKRFPVIFFGCHRNLPFPKNGLFVDFDFGANTSDNVSWEKFTRFLIQ